MTAINDLVKKACVLDSKEAKGLEPGSMQLAEAGEAFSLLYAYVYEILEAYLSLELLRIEFKMPAAPHAQEPPAEEKAPAPMPKEARAVAVGPINVYAITKEIQDALDRMGKETLDVTAAYANYVPQEKMPVITPAARITEAQEVAPPERPQADKRPIESKKIEVLPIKADHIITTREAPRIEKVSQPAHVLTARKETSKEAPSYDKAPIKNIPVGVPAHEEAVEREIKRSVTVINELREVYDILLTNAPSITGLEKEAGDFSLPASAFGGALKVPSQAEEMPAPSPAGGRAPFVQAPPGTVVPPQPSITIPVPMARPITSQVTPGTPALRRPSATAAPAGNVAHASGGKGHPVSPEVRLKVSKGEDEEEHIELRYKSIEVPLIKPVLKAPPTAEESAANARMISEAIAKSSTPIVVPEPPPSGQAPVKKPIAEHQAQPSFEAARWPGDATPAKAAMTAALPMASPMQAARALSTVYSTVHHTVNVMEGYANAAASISRAASVAAESGRGSNIETPITRLLYAASLPIASPVSPLNLPLITGQVPAFNPAAEGRVEAAAPAINLVMGIAASRAMQSAGGSAINNFISVMPSLGGGLQGPIPVERLGAGPINIHVPPAPSERGQEAGAVNKVSSFHNTFNITVSMKGGSDDGDLRDLGKKIGRILSDEIKRYGGI